MRLAPAALLLSAGAALGYEGSVEPMEGVLFEWTVDSSSIEVTLTAPTTGWVGFGISENGGMSGADLVVANVADNGGLRVTDYYAVANDMPAVDDCQNWEILSGEERGGSTTVTVRRALDTDDSQDRPIVDDGEATRLVVAFAEKDKHEDLKYHGDNRVAFRANLFSGAPTNPLAAIKAANGVLPFAMLNDNFEIPEDSTTYHTTCALGPASDDGQPLYLEAVEHHLDDEGGKFVHHFVTTYFEGGCNEASLDMEGEMIWAWAPGVEPLAYPEGTAFRITDDDGNPGCVCMQTHYDNPLHKEGKRDGSGVDFYYTSTPPEQEVGILQLGDPSLALAGLDIPGGRTSEVMITCPGDCTNQWPGPITVFSQQLHMHQVGAYMTVEQYRGGKQVYNSTLEFYSFAFQDKVRRPKGFQFDIRPGDDLLVHCVWQNDGRDDRSIGQASDEEMCISFLYYYPRMAPELQSCGTGTECEGDVSGGSNYPLDAADYRHFGVRPAHKLTADPGQCVSSVSSATTLGAGTIAGLVAVAALGLGW